MKQKTQYKQTPIGFIPADWEVKKLGELTVGKGTYGINASAVEYNELLPKYLRITDIDDEGYFSVDKLSSVDDSSSKDFYLEENDIVFVRTGSTTGKSYLYNPNDGLLVYAGFLIKFSLDKSKVDKYYIWSFTKSDKYNDWVNTFSQRSGQPGLNSNEYASLLIPLPPLPEQQKIAEILSTWDKAIQEVELLIKKIEVRNKALAFSLLIGKKRVKGFEGKWEIKNFGKIISRVTKKNEELNDTVVTISAKRGFILQEDFFNKRVASNTLSGYYLLKKGQFAYNKSYSNGYPMGVFKRLNDFDKAVVTTLYICFELKENICSDFMVHYFDSGLMNNNLMKIAKEGGRAHGLLNIGIEDFMNLKITMPSLEEQTAIAAILNTAQQELKQYQEKLKALQQQKKGLMQQLLTGKIRTI